MLILLFLSLFSICSVNINNSYSSIDKLIVNDSIPAKYSADWQDTTFYYGNSDFLGQSALMTWTRYLDANQLGDSNGKWDIFNHNLNVNQEINYSYNFVNNNAYYYLDSNVSGTGVKWVNQVRFKKIHINNQFDYYELDFYSADYPVVAVEYRLYYDLNREQIEHTGYTSDTLDGIILNCSMRSSYSTDYVTDGVLCANRFTDEFVYNVFNQNYYSIDYNAGYNYGYTQGSDYGYDNGYNNGYQNGYAEGYSIGSATDGTASTIFTGILDVALIPVNVFLSIFNFDVFGINIAGIVSALLTVSVVVIIFRFVFGGKKDD